MVDASVAIAGLGGCPYALGQWAMLPQRMRSTCCMEWTLILLQ